MIRIHTAKALLRCLALGIVGALLAPLAGSLAQDPDEKIGQTIRQQRKLVAKRPDNASAHNDLGNLLQWVGKIDDAESSYRRAVELEPEHLSANYNLSLLMYDRGQLKKSYKLLKRLIESHPEHAWSHYQMGRIRNDLGNHTVAIKHYAQAFTLQPDLAFPDVNPHVLYNELATAALLKSTHAIANEESAPRQYDDGRRIAELLVAEPRRARSDAPPEEVVAEEPNTQRRDSRSAAATLSTSADAAGEAAETADEETVDASGATRTLTTDDLRGTKRPSSSSTGAYRPSGASRGGLTRTTPSNSPVGRPTVPRNATPRPESTPNSIRQDRPAVNQGTGRPVRFRPGVRSSAQLDLRIGDTQPAG